MRNGRTEQDLLRHSRQKRTEIKELNPETEVTFSIECADIRAGGTYYAKAREKGVLFVRYEPEEKPEVKKDGQKLTVSFLDKVIRERMEIEPIPVLSAATHARNNDDIASVLKIQRTWRLFLEAT